MKKLNIKSIFSMLLILLSLSVIVVACKKEKDGSPDMKTGDMSSGAINPNKAAGGESVVLTGSGIGQIRTIVFEKNNVPAPFTPTLNTETNLIFRVPDTAYGGDQNVIFTNADGKTLSVPFSVIALPSVTAAWPTDFQANTEITLTGNNLDDVSAVVFDGTTTAATIVSKTRKQMVIKMPSTTITRGKLKLTNLSGIRVTDMEFVNVDMALKVFSDQLDNGFESWSWGGDFSASTDDKV